MIINNKMIRRKSRQRQIILQLLRQSVSHPTAQEIYEQVRNVLPSASLGNVYRNLGILAEGGLIVRREFCDGIEHYDAVTENHSHFICETCGGVSDFDLSCADLLKQARASSSYRIDRFNLDLFGMCPTCRKGNKKQQGE